MSEQQLPMPDRMGTETLDVDLAIERLGALAQPVAEWEEVELGAALGRVAAEDVAAPIDLPPFDASAMDGYAVRSAGLDREGAKRLRIVGRSAAGHPFHASVGAGEAVRIFTGAVLPTGADAVLLQEDARVVQDVRVAQDARAAQEAVETTAPIRADQHVRHRGHDVRQGATLFEKGKRLGAFDLAWMAACGIRSLQVRRRIRVAVLSTGDELAPPGERLAPGQIYDSNRLALKSLLQQKAVRVDDLGCIADDPAEIRKALHDAAAQADLIACSGGVSVGDADYVKAVVEEIGSLDFWRVALKPGKPLTVGRIGRALFFGLPGNPVSTIVTYLLFVAPTVDRLSGTSPSPPLALPAVLLDAVRHSKGRREYMRGIMRAEGGKIVVHITGDQGSNRLATFADANCLVVVASDVGDLLPGDATQVIPLPGIASHPMLAAP